MKGRIRILNVIQKSCAAMVFIAGSILAVPIIDPYYAGSYSLTSLGTPAGVPARLGGLTIEAGDSNRLLIGGAANTMNSDLFDIAVTRDAQGHIDGFSGSGTFYADAYGAGGGIDGGLAYGPGGVLFYTSYPDGRLGQIKPGSIGPDKLTNLAAAGHTGGSTGTLQFIPSGFANAGQIVIGSYIGSYWRRATLTPDGSGTYNVSAPINTVTLSGGLEGIIFVPTGSALFGNPSILVAEYSQGRVSSSELDANSDPIVTSRRTFISGLSGAEGAMLDPITNDFLFSTFGGGNQVLRVSGFAAPVDTPEPGSMLLLGGGLLAGAFQLRRRR
jgi:hypothetical protein